ncbi:MAG: acyl carrier protein [Eubacteriaceae bacterium]|nr:acyl carrier protein [Eubacteriaceae bacterium]
MVLEKVTEILKNYSDAEGINITKDTTFKDLGIDSLDFVEILMELEEKLGVELEIEENFATIGELVNYIEQKLK